MSDRKKFKLYKDGRIRILAFGDSLTEGYADWGTTWQPYGDTLKTKLAERLPEYRITVDVNGLSGDCVSASLGAGFMDRLELALPNPVAGSTASPGRPSTPEPAGYDLVILLGGTNDLAYKYRHEDGPREIFEALKECYSHILGSGSALLCLSVPERYVDTQASIEAQKCRNARLELNELIFEYVDNFKATADWPSVYFMDLAKAVPFKVERQADDDGAGVPSLWSNDGLHMTVEGYEHVGEILAEYIHGLIASQD